MWMPPFSQPMAVGQAGKSKSRNRSKGDPGAYCPAIAERQEQRQPMCAFIPLLYHIGQNNPHMKRRLPAHLFAGWEPAAIVPVEPIRKGILGSYRVCLALSLCMDFGQ